MSDADQAFEFAERLIAEAAGSGQTVLSLDREETHALTELPDSIGQLDQLTLLDLNNTAISDLAPLAGLSGLRTLWLTQTQVSDLTPLRGLTLLAMEPGTGGLTFKDTPANRTTPRLAEIAAIEDNKDRAQALFDWLDAQEERGDSADTTPEPDPLIPIEVSDARLEIPATLPSEAEVEERLKHVLHQQLRDRATALCRAAGNRYPRLSARARTLDKLLEPELADTDLLQLHLAVEDLRVFEETGEEEAGDPLPSEVLGPLKEVLDRGPGLTLGNEEVDALVERANRRRAAGPEDEAARAAQDAMSRAVAADERNVGPRLRDAESQVAESDTAEAHEAQEALNKNIIIRIGRMLLTGANAVTASVAMGTAATVVGPDLISLLSAAPGAFLDAAATYGAEVSGWFARVLSDVPQLKPTVEAWWASRARNASPKARD